MNEFKVAGLSRIESERFEPEVNFEVDALIDGAEISLAVNLLQLMRYRYTALNTYFFNCSCGIPGCAGLHAPARIRFTPNLKTILVKFPSEGYAKYGIPSEYSFDSTNFYEELDKVISLVKEATKDMGAFNFESHEFEDTSDFISYVTEPSSRQETLSAIAGHCKTKCFTWKSEGAYMEIPVYEFLDGFLKAKFSDYKFFDKPSAHKKAILTFGVGHDACSLRKRFRELLSPSFLKMMLGGNLLSSKKEMKALGLKVQDLYCFDYLHFDASFEDKDWKDQLSSFLTEISNKPSFTYPKLV